MIHANGNRQIPEAFPGSVSTWNVKTEAIRTIGPVPFYGCKLFMDNIQDLRTFYLLCVTRERHGIKYNFPNFTITFIPWDAHYGNVTIIGNKWRTKLVHQKLKNYLKHYKRNRYDPKFRVGKEIADYSRNKFFSELKYPPFIHADFLFVASNVHLTVNEL